MYTWMIVLGIGFTFLMTVLGASLVFCFKKDVSSKLNAAFLGITSGIMLAASIWSLLLPALEQAEKDFGKAAFLPVAIGFLFGGAILVLLEKITPILKNEGGRYAFTDENSKKSGRLFLAVTLHNIPEGLAVGFAFGAAAMSGTLAGYTTALGLAIGMGIQNFPEGAAVALPMRNTLKSNKKAFFYGAASGIVEPVFSVIGFFLAALQTLQPWLLSFAAGAMIYVVSEDLLPDIHEDRKMGAWGMMLGFVLMMVFDVALG